MKPTDLSTQKGQVFSGAGTSRQPHLLLLGGGHAHVQVLAAIGDAPERWPAAQITLVTPYERQFYSGMLPGWMAGRYPEDACVIPLGPLAAQAGVRSVLGRATALDANARRVSVTLDDGRTEDFAYDLLSIDTGSEMHADSLPGAAEHGLLVRPLEGFLPAWQDLLRKAANRPFRLAVIGSGAAGVELAFAARRALNAGSSVVLVEGRQGLMAGFPAGVRERVARALAQRGIPREPGGALALDGAGVRLGAVPVGLNPAVAGPVGGRASGSLGSPATLARASGSAHGPAMQGQVAMAGSRHLACDAALIATGGLAPRWLQGSGLALDVGGRIQTDPSLRSVSHPTVFAAGDVATRVDAPHARSGVYAVRAGPPLSRNLRRALAGDPNLEAYTPQAQALYLLACGDGAAIASRGPWSAEGRWIGWWKDHIDRSFIRRWQRDT